MATGPTQIIEKALSRSAAMTIVGVGVILIALSNAIHVELISLMTGVIGILMTTAAATVELYKYLQTVRRRDPAFRSIMSNREIERRDNRIGDLELNVVSIKRRIDAFGAIDLNSGNAVSEPLKQALLARVRDIATDELVTEWAEKFGRPAILEQHIRRIREEFRGAIASLEKEIEALGKRSSVQMASGAVVSVVGFLVLGFFIYKAGDGIDVAHLDGKLAGYLLLRAGLVIMIELFALFFLRMYRYSLFETKYFQNEISNIYLKSVAVEILLSDSEKDIKKSVINELIASERNIILRKGDISLSQLRDIAERDGDAVLLNFIKSVPDSLVGAARVFSKRTP